MINVPALIVFGPLKWISREYHAKFPVDNCFETLYNRIKGAEGKSSAEPIPQRAGLLRTGGSGCVNMVPELRVRY